MTANERRLEKITEDQMVETSIHRTRVAKESIEKHAYNHSC